MKCLIFDSAPPARPLFFWLWRYVGVLREPDSLHGMGGPWEMEAEKQNMYGNYLILYGN